MTSELQEGDSVVVNTGTKDPDMGFDIGGWQGRVEEFYDDENTVLIRWDSVTLKGMDYDLIIQCEIENLDWEIMVLDLTEVHKTEPRDTEKDMNKTAMKLQNKLMKDPRLR